MMNLKKIDYLNELTSFQDQNAKIFLYKKISVLNYPSVFLFIGTKASNVCVVYGKRIKYLSMDVLISVLERDFHCS